MSPPPSSTLELDRSVRVLEHGTLLVGGDPLRLIRLSDQGARLLAGWRSGLPVGGEPGAQRLAARLTDAGMLHPVPATGPWTRDHVAVIVPARDRLDQLAACLAASGPVGELVVVDDGSADHGALAAIAAESGARVLRCDAGTGPAAARNVGLAATSAPVVAFVDSDARASPGWLEPLLGHFSDPLVGAVAPRIAVPPGHGAVAAYEAVRSPLDLGRAPGAVGPGRRIAFVPAAAVLVRREALGSGFDPFMRYGEDVDLVWRLVAAGWTVRYEPSSVVVHPHRATAGAWLAQRVAYGSSAGPLDARHPGQLRHVVAPAWALASCALALAGRPRLAVGTAVVAGGSVAARLPGPRGAMAGVAARAQLRVARALVDSTLRAYQPLLLAGAVTSRRFRRVAAAGLAASVLIDWRERRPRLDPLRYGALRTADDLAYATGLWLGCARARRAGPLVPRLVGGRLLTSSSRRTGRR